MLKPLPIVRLDREVRDRSARTRPSCTLQHIRRQQKRLDLLAHPRREPLPQALAGLADLNLHRLRALHSTRSNGSLAVRWLVVNHLRMHRSLYSGNAQIRRCASARANRLAAAAGGYDGCVALGGDAAHFEALLDGVGRVAVQREF